MGDRSPVSPGPSPGSTTVINANTSSIPQGNGNTTTPVDPAVLATLDFDSNTTVDSAGNMWSTVVSPGNPNAVDPNTYGVVSAEHVHSGNYAFKIHTASNAYNQSGVLASGGLLSKGAPSSLHVRAWMYINAPLPNYHANFMLVSSGRRLSVLPSGAPELLADSNNKLVSVYNTDITQPYHFDDELRLSTQENFGPAGGLGADTDNLLLNPGNIDAAVHASDQGLAAMTSDPNAIYFKPGRWFCTELGLDTTTQTITVWVNGGKVLLTQQWDGFSYMGNARFTQGVYDPANGVEATAADMAQYTDLVPIPALRYIALGWQSYADTNSPAMDVYVDSIVVSSAYIGCDD